MASRKDTQRYRVNFGTGEVTPQTFATRHEAERWMTAAKQQGQDPAARSYFIEHFDPVASWVAVLSTKRQRHAKKSRSLKHWKVKFTRRGMEPPRPFGKTTAIVCAENREAAKALVPASPSYPITVSATTDPVTFTYTCYHQAEEASSTESPEVAETALHATKKRSPAQLDREINAALAEHRRR